MPWGLKRYQNSGTTHFITFSCYRRQPLLTKHGASRMFEQALEEARVKYGFFVFGYVVMPEHVHMLVSEPKRGTLATAIKAIKQSVARRQIRLGGSRPSSQRKDPHKAKSACVGHPKPRHPTFLAEEILRLQCSYT
jgi:REP element-mobilizing transposase RayT